MVGLRNGTNESFGEMDYFLGAKKTPTSATPPPKKKKKFHDSLNINIFTSSRNGAWAAICKDTTSFFLRIKLFIYRGGGSEQRGHRINWETKRKGKKALSYRF